MCKVRMVCIYLIWLEMMSLECSTKQIKQKRFLQGFLLDQLFVKEPMSLGIHSSPLYFVAVARYGHDSKVMSCPFWQISLLLTYVCPKNKSYQGDSTTQQFWGRRIGANRFGMCRFVMESPTFPNVSKLQVDAQEYYSLLGTETAFEDIWSMLEGQINTMSR